MLDQNLNSYWLCLPCWFLVYWSDDQVLLATILEFVGGFVFTSLGLYYASWISHPTAWSYNPVDEHQFKGALIYTFFYPFGFMLLMDAISRLITFRGLSRLIRIVIMLAFGVICFVGGILALTDWDGQAYFKMTDTDPKNANVLYESLLGYELVLTWIPVSITMFVIIVYYLFKDYFGMDVYGEAGASGNRGFGGGGQYKRFGDSPGTRSLHSSPAPGGATSRAGASLMDASLSNGSRAYRWFMILFFLFILLPGLWASTCFLPGDWHHGYVYQIASSVKPSRSPWTILLEIGSGDNARWMHIYFDVIIFYIGLFVTLFFGAVIKCCEDARNYVGGNLADSLVHFAKFFRKERLFIPIGWNTIFFSLMQLIVGLIWMSIIGAIWIMFYWHHTFSGMSNASNPPKMYENLEQATRTMGILATIFLGLAFIPVTRGNFINRYCLGLSFEGTVKYHRILGWLMSLCALFHCMGWVINFDKAGYFKSPYHYYPLSFAPWTYYHADNFSLALMWYVMITCFIFLFVASWISWFRRAFFQIWYALHLYFAMVLVIGLMFHATNGWYFMIPGMVLQFYERLYRLYISSNEQSIKYLDATGDGDHSGCTRLVINRNNKYPETPLGSYYFINIPNVNPFEWHPFSVSNSLNNNVIEFFIRRSGDWTGKLNDLALRASSSSVPDLNNITVNLEGPYGTGINYNNYDSIILIAGGIGITPFHNIFFTLYNEAQSGWKNRIPYIHLIWVVKFAEMFEMFNESFNQFHEYPAQNMRIQLFATQGQARKNSHLTDLTVQSIQPMRDGIDCPLEWKIGRPHLDHELHFLAGKRNGALVYACGPESLVNSARELAFRHGNHFKMETFIM